jgi:hypothetical protein
MLTETCMNVESKKIPPPFSGIALNEPTLPDKCYKPHMNL